MVVAVGVGLPGWCQGFGARPGARALRTGDKTSGGGGRGSWPQPWSGTGQWEAGAKRVRMDCRKLPVAYLTPAGRNLATVHCCLSSYLRLYAQPMHGAAVHRSIIPATRCPHLQHLSDGAEAERVRQGGLRAGGHQLLGLTHPPLQLLGGRRVPRAPPHHLQLPLQRPASNPYGPGIVGGAHVGLPLLHRLLKCSTRSKDSWDW